MELTRASQGASSRGRRRGWRLVSIHYIKPAVAMETILTPSQTLASSKITTLLADEMIEETGVNTLKNHLFDVVDARHIPRKLGQV